MNVQQLAEMLFGAFGIAVAVIGLAIQVAVGVIIAYYTVETQKLRKASERQILLAETRQLWEHAPCYYLKHISCRSDIKGQLAVNAQLQVLVDRPAFDCTLVFYYKTQECFHVIYRGCLLRRYEGDVILDGASAGFYDSKSIEPFLQVYPVEPEVILSKLDKDGNKAFLLLCDIHRNVFIEEFIQDAKDGLSYRLDKYECISVGS